MRSIKNILSKIKPFLKWFIIGIVSFYLVKIFKDNWYQIQVINLDFNDYLTFIISLFITFLSHVFAGFIWYFILEKTFTQKIKLFWILKVYLITNMAKYIPGNIWHFYGRINTIYKKGITLGIASISVLLEPLLMAASALLITLISHGIGVISISENNLLLILELIILIITLISFHPKVINPIIHHLSKLKFKNKVQENEVLKTELKSYPLIPLIGELIFVILRSIGFLLIVNALTPINILQIPILISTFSFAWLLGLVVPGSPGGLGIFEATIIALLNNQFPQEVIIISVAIFRIISILAEVIAAAIAYTPQFFNKNKI